MACFVFCSLHKNKKQASGEEKNQCKHLKLSHISHLIHAEMWCKRCVYFVHFSVIFLVRVLIQFFYLLHPSPSLLVGFCQCNANIMAGWDCWRVWNSTSLISPALSPCGFSLHWVPLLLVLPQGWLMQWIESEGSGSGISNLIHICLHGRTCSYVSPPLQTVYALASTADTWPSDYLEVLCTVLLCSSTEDE